MKKIVLNIILVLITAVLVGCKNKKYETIKVVATQVPHEVILIEAIPYLNELGYDLDIIVISDYSLGNPAVSSGSADANFFQHIPYLNEYNARVKNNEKLVNIGNIHIEPIGLYGGSKNNIEDIKAGDKIIISDNIADYGRIVDFLKNIELVETVIDFKPTSVYASPEEAILTKKVDFEFKVIDAALLVKARENKEGAYLFINGNYALEGGLGLDDVILLEPTVNNPYVNIIACLNGNEENPKIKALVKVLTSKAIQDFIKNKYDGSVIPA